MPLEAPLSAEEMRPDQPAPLTPVDPSAAIEITDEPDKVYLLVKTDDHSAFRVVQYSTSPRTEYTISKFLDFCRDDGWDVMQTK